MQSNCAAEPPAHHADEGRDDNAAGIDAWQEHPGDKPDDQPDDGVPNHVQQVSSLDSQCTLIYCAPFGICIFSDVRLQQPSS